MRPQEHELTPELLAERLQERIYASLALLAILLSMGKDIRHGEAALLIAGTVISLWAASIFSVLISRAMVYTRHKLTRDEIRHQLVVHSPLLASASTPLILIGLSALHLFSMDVAVKISVVWLLIFMAASSIISVRKAHPTATQTWIAAGITFAIGMFIVSIKIATSH